MPKAVINGKSIYYEAHGEGEPVIFVNALMMTTVNWLLQVEPFARRYKLILFDLLGQGQSDYVTENLTLEMQADIIKGLLDHLNIEKAHMYGTSFGSFVAMTFALKHQERLKTLTLQGTWGKFDYHAMKNGEVWIDVAMMRNPDKLFDFFMTLVFAPQFYNNNQPRLEELKKIWWTKVLSARENWVEAFAALTRSLYTFDILNRLPEIKIPTLILAGAQDKIMSLENHDEVHKAIPGSAYIILKNSGHCPHIERPEEFRYILFGFIEAHKKQ